jgi:hypothetical protein
MLIHIGIFRPLLVAKSLIKLQTTLQKYYSTFLWPCRFNNLQVEGKGLVILAAKSLKLQTMLQ